MILEKGNKIFKNNVTAEMIFFCIIKHITYHTPIANPTITDNTMPIYSSNSTPSYALLYYRLTITQNIFCTFESIT